VQAQYEAIFRSWTHLVALQIEYNLLQRTVEADLIPMALEMGLGVTPWSPLKGGVLTGKYSRDGTEGGKKRGRGEWVSRNLSEEAHRVVEVLRAAAREAGCTPSQAAIAWVQSRPGVVSTIIGARTMEQLDDNLRALEVRLSPDQTARLDEATRPVLPFPHELLRGTLDNTQGGTTINGRDSRVWGMAPKSDAERH
jgi:aryl-alcohol dehydrogenase-like predicted oxidoreductase